MDKPPTVLEQQVTMTFEQAVTMLSYDCTWGCKKNSQGNISYWKGYKLHLDVTDAGIPVSMLVTGANVHDSHAAIPLEMMTETRVTHLYSLMDSAPMAPSLSARSSRHGKEFLLSTTILAVRIHDHPSALRLCNTTRQEAR